MSYSGQRQIAFQHGFNDALFGRPSNNPYDAAVVGGSFAAYAEGYELGLISDTPPRGPKGDKGDKGDTGAAGINGAPGTNGTDGNQTYVGAGAPSGALGLDGDVYIDSDNGDIYTKSGGIWNLQGNVSTVALTTRFDIVDPDVVPTVSYRGDALPGTLTSNGAWRITRITEASDGDVEILYADGNDSFDNIWDNRAALTYL